MQRSRFTGQQISFALQQPRLSVAGEVSLGGAAPEPLEFIALGKSGGAGNRKAEPIRLCPSIIHPPRCSGCSKAKPYPPDGQAEYTVTPIG